jgi:hypothetical protein
VIGHNRILKLSLPFFLLGITSALITTIILNRAQPKNQPPFTETTSTQFGFIKNVYFQNGKYFLDLDPAIWLDDSGTGSSALAASKAFVEDGNGQGWCQIPVTAPCVPDGYYIRNLEHTTTTYAVTAGTLVNTLIQNENWDSNSPTLEPYKTLTISKFTGIYRDQYPPGSWVKDAPYDITLKNNSVVSISQRYIP